MKLATLLLCVATAAHAEPAPRPVHTAANDKAAAAFVEVVRKVTRVAIDNQNDCARMAAVMGLVYDGNKEVVVRGQQVVANERVPDETFLELMRLQKHLGEMVTRRCKNDAAVAAAIGRFAAKPLQPPGLDDKMVQRFLKVFTAVSDAIVANSPDCKKTAAVVNRILDANEDLITAMRADWSGRTTLQVADHMAADMQRIQPAMRKCDASAELHVALHRFGTDAPGTPPQAPPPTYGFDDPVVKKFIAVSERVTEVAIASAPDCAKIGASVNRLLDANVSVLADFQQRASQVSLDVWARINANTDRLETPMQPCGGDPAVKRALLRLMIP
jgi:hypothetical protein